jgi:hypothetical protein
MNGLSAPLPPSDGCELIRVSLHDLLSEEEVALLRAASEVGCELSLLGREGRAVVGDQPPSSVFDAMTTGSPQVVREQRLRVSGRRSIFMTATSCAGSSASCKRAQSLGRAASARRTT